MLCPLSHARPLQDHKQKVGHWDTGSCSNYVATSISLTQTYVHLQREAIDTLPIAFFASKDATASPNVQHLPMALNISSNFFSFNPSKHAADCG